VEFVFTTRNWSFLCVFWFSVCLPCSITIDHVDMCEHVYWCLCEWVFVYCICQWTATRHSSLLLLSFLFFFLVANPSSSLHWRYTVLFITIVTFYNVFFYHILYVRNNIKSHFQIWTVCLITKIDMRDIFFFPWWYNSIGGGNGKPHSMNNIIWFQLFAGVFGLSLLLCLCAFSCKL